MKGILNRRKTFPEMKRRSYKQRDFQWEKWDGKRSIECEVSKWLTQRGGSVGRVLLGDPNTFQP